MNKKEQEYNIISRNLKIYSYLITFVFMGIAALILLGVFGWLGPTLYTALSIFLGILVIYLFFLKRKVTRQVNIFVANVDNKYGKPNEVLKMSLDIVFKPDTNYKNFTSKVQTRKEEK